MLTRKLLSASGLARVTRSKSCQQDFLQTAGLSIVPNPGVGMASSGRSNPAVTFFYGKTRIWQTVEQDIGEQITEIIFDYSIRGETMSEEFIKHARFENDRIIKIAKEIVFNPNEPFDERFRGLLVLMENAAMRIQQLQYGEIRLKQVYKGFCEKAITIHKQKRIQEFTEKWQGKDVCEEMAEELKMIEKPESLL